MIELLLVLAQSVLGPIIVDLVTGRTAAVRKHEIEVAIAATARERQAFTPDQLDQVVRHTMEEVLNLIDRNPDLDWKLQKVRLARPVAKDDSPEQRNDVVTERLRRLSDLVEQRRKDLGLPLPVRMSAVTQVPSPTIVWEEPEPLEKELWERELAEMKARVQRRRTQSRKGTGDV